MGSLQLWEGGRWVGGIWGHGGVPRHMHMHMHAHTCTCMHTHARNTKINMLENCKWLPPWRQPCLSCLTCMHVCVHMHACACMCVHMHACACMCVHMCIWGAPTQSHPIHPPTHPPPRWYPSKSVKTR